MTGHVTPHCCPLVTRAEWISERRSQRWDVWSRSGLFRENNQTIIAGEVTSLKQTMQRKIVKILIYSNWISSSECVVSESKNAFSILTQRKRFTLWKWVISEAIGGELLYRGDSSVSTNTIQRINNSSAKSTTKSEPDKEPPQWPGCCDAKSLWNCPLSRSW